MILPKDDCTTSHVRTCKCYDTYKCSRFLYNNYLPDIIILFVFARLGEKKCSVLQIC